MSFVLLKTTKQAAGKNRKKLTNQRHRTTPNPAHQRADGLNPTKQADHNQRKLVSNLEARLNKASAFLVLPVKASFGKRETVSLGTSDCERAIDSDRTDHSVHTSGRQHAVRAEISGSCS